MMQELFGVLAIDKPAGKTSRDVVNVIQRITRPWKAKVGHTGTLDPLATGVLLVAVGRATRLVEFSHEAPKEYMGSFRLGCTSPSLDSDSEVQILDDAPLIDRAALVTAITQFRGPIKQTPPAFSAIHVDGKRAYELARKGEHVEIPQRDVTIFELEVAKFEYPDFQMQTCCSTGTYIRTLGNDIASVCGSNAIMTDLRRTRIGDFHIDHCHQLEHFRSIDDVVERLEAPSRLVQHMQTLLLSQSQLADVSNGRKIERCPQTSPAERVAAFDQSGNLAAILRSDDAHWRAEKVFVSSNPVAAPSKTSTPHSAES